MWRRQQRQGGAEIMMISDVAEQISDPLTLQPGHKLRGERCLLCGMVAGGRLVRIATVIDTRKPPSECGAIPSIAYLICSEHETGADLDIATPAISRCTAAHRRARA